VRGIELRDGVKKGALSGALLAAAALTRRTRPVTAMIALPTLATLATGAMRRSPVSALAAWVTRCALWPRTGTESRRVSSLAVAAEPALESHGPPGVGLPNGELRFPACGHLSLDARQRRAYERAVHRTFGPLERCFGGNWRRRFVRIGFGWWRGRHLLTWRRGRDDLPRPAVEHLRVQRSSRLLLLALWRHLRLLVVVLGVAGRAPCLLDIGSDHGDDRVIGYSTFSRTVVVQNVTKP
jgi:hypothetical protein